MSYPRIFADGMSGTFTTDSFVISGEGSQTISLPFVYAGAVTGYLESPRMPGDPNAVFAKTLTGSLPRRSPTRSVATCGSSQ